MLIKSSLKISNATYFQSFITMGIAHGFTHWVKVKN